MFGGIPVRKVLDVTYIVIITAYHMVDEHLIKKQCSGGVIAKKQILSSSYCFTKDELINPRVMDVYAYNPVLAKGSEVLYALIHPKYTTREKGFDIAVVAVNEEFDHVFNNLGGGVDKMSHCYIYTFKQNVNGLVGQTLVKSKVDVRTGKPACKGMEVVLCAHSTENNSPCEGDQGAPLFCDLRLKGILSRGIAFDSCRPKMGTMMFEDLSVHRDFIRNLTGIEVAIEENHQPPSNLAKSLLQYTGLFYLFFLMI
ncbi:uncharacterized protein LOC112127272 [Cimex lectularius]|uniref:Peptidase S1 domain-containing protein n=1 Tax=Cimex lectularius TaxID=79782 RepID=A0A8I6TKK6_CIMLE|nr:uncharacterized protein LOC112127272 [Cimex lectularius]